LIPHEKQELDTRHGETVAIIPSPPPAEREATRRKRIRIRRYDNPYCGFAWKARTAQEVYTKFFFVPTALMD
jgi:hypothetical protein